MLFTALLSKDWWQIRGWFKTHAGTKGLVVVGFLLVILLVSAGIYFLAESFFYMLTAYGSFGQAVITYLVNAAILVLWLMGIGLSMAAAFAGFYRDQSLRHIISLPLSIKSVFMNRFLMLTGTSSWAVIMVMVPILLAYGKVQSLGLSYWFWGLVGLVLVILSSQTIGTLMSMGVTYRLGGNAKGLLILGAVTLVITMAVAGKVLLPPRLFHLADAPDETAFQQQLGTLPLASRVLPSYWLASTIIIGPSGLTLLAVIMTLGLLLILRQAADKYFLTSWYRFKENGVLAGKTAGVLKPTHFPNVNGVESALIANDLLWFARSPTELIYFLLILCLGIALWLIIRLVPFGSGMEERWLSLIYLSTIVGYGYLVTVVSARFMYPLMAKEQKAIWFLFSTPFPRGELIDTKISFSLILLLPWILLGFSLASMLVLPLNATILLILLLLMLAVAIAVVQVTLGIIAPNFPEGDRPDSASTSTSGLAALMVSLILVTAAGYGWWRYLQGTTQGLGWGVAVVGIGLVLLVALAFKSIYRYEKI
jgi:hypothetical protein